MSDQMKPGRELDARIAELLFGWTDLDPQARWGKYDYGDPGCEWTRVDEPWCRGLGVSPDTRCGIPKPYPRFSEDIAAAWTVAEKLDIGLIKVDDGWMAFVDNPRFGYTDKMTIDTRLDVSATAGTAPLAICLAALKAIEENS